MWKEFVISFFSEFTSENQQAECGPTLIHLPHHHRAKQFLKQWLDVEVHTKQLEKISIIGLSEDWTCSHDLINIMF